MLNDGSEEIVVYQTMAWRSTLVQGLTLFVCGWITIAQYEDIDNISIRATKIVPTTQFYVRDEFPTALFPSLNFTCSGRITRLWFIGRFSEGTDSVQTLVPTFRLWIANRSTDQSFSDAPILRSATPLLCPQNMDQLTLITVELTRGEFINFTTGDIIEISNPDPNYDRFSLLYHRNGGPNFFQETALNNISSRSLLIWNDYPLLAVETKPRDCATRFLSRAILQSLMKNIVAYPQSDALLQYIIPELSLMCTKGSNTTHVEGIIGGELKETSAEGTTKPPLMISWWQQNGLSYDLRAAINITNLRPIRGRPNTYSFRLRLRFNETAEYVLGIRLNTQIFKLYHDSNMRNIMNHRVMFEPNTTQVRINNLSGSESPVIRGVPLLSSANTDSLFNENCIKRLPKAMDVYLSALLIQKIIYTPRLFPDAGSTQRTTNNSGVVYLLIGGNPFSTAGSITSWVFAARANTTRPGSLRNPSQFPQLQIWRLMDRAYHLRNTTRIDTFPPILLGALNMYTHKLNPPASYKENDIIGIYQPSSENAGLQLAFVENTAAALQAIVKSTSLATTGTIMVSRVQRIPLQILPLMTLTTQVAVEPSQTYFSIRSRSVRQKSIGSQSAIQGSPTTSQGLPLPSPKANENLNLSASTLGNGAIIAIVVGVLGSVILLMFIIIFMLAIYIAKKKSNSKNFIIQNNLPLSPTANQAVHHNPFNNPTHTGANSTGINNANHFGGSTALTRAASEEYEIPVTSHVGSRGNNTSLYQDVSQPYETPAAKTLNETEKHIYHVLETPTKNKVQSDEVEIYVPAGDHRQVLLSSKSIDQQQVNIYATLTENQLSMVRSDGSYFVESEAFWKPASDQEQLYHQLCANKYREIARQNIKVIGKLGSGHFGEVCKGVWTKMRETSVDVAIKMLKPVAQESDRVTFLQEAAIMGQFRHPNIVTLMGVVTIGNPVMMILELLANGDLRSYLNKQKPALLGVVSSDWPGKLLNFCQHIAAGMDYLHKKGFIHRDLAARNILVADNNTCKISDFGLSRDLEEENYYVSKGGMIPVKWTAPEALNFKKFSPPCDVWSYGIVMYEIWSLGNKPYKRTKNMEVLPKVEEGYRLPPPPGCPREIYRIMIQCWHLEASCRPTFSEVLDSLLQPESELLYWKVAEGVDRPEAAMLGAPLEAGEQLYPELQYTYMSMYEAASIPLQ